MKNNCCIERITVYYYVYMSKINKINDIKKTLLEKEELDRKVRDISFSDELMQYADYILDYHRKYGDFKISVRERTEDNLPIGRFVYAKLRSRFRRWKKYHYSNDIQKSDYSQWIEKLSDSDFSFFMKIDKLGFSESFEDSQSDWNRGYKDLEKYFNNFGHSYVNERAMERNNPLVNWVNNQRASRKKGKLSVHRIIKLNKLNFLWTLDLGAILSNPTETDDLVLETKVNLKKTLDNATSDQGSALIADLDAERIKLIRLEKKQREETHNMELLKKSVDEFETTMQQLDQRLASLDYISINDPNPEVIEEKERLQKFINTCSSEVKSSERTIQRFYLDENKRKQEIDKLKKNIISMNKRLGKEIE